MKFISGAYEPISQAAQNALGEFPWQVVQNRDELLALLGEDPLFAFVGHGVPDGIYTADGMKSLDLTDDAALEGKKGYIVACNPGNQLVPDAVGKANRKTQPTDVLAHTQTFFFLFDDTKQNQQDPILLALFDPARAALNVLSNGGSGSAARRAYEAATLGAKKTVQNAPSAGSSTQTGLADTFLDWNNASLVDFANTPLGGVVVFTPIAIAAVLGAVALTATQAGAIKKALGG